MKNNKLIFKQYIYSFYLFCANYFLKFFGLAKVIPNKFILISRSRTGSTMLIRHVRKIPNSLVLGEILGRSRGFVFWKDFLRLFYKYHWFRYAIVGFKYFYYHPVDNPQLKNATFEFLEKKSDIKIIHLVREDLFAVILSKIIAEKTGEWSKKSTKQVSRLEPFVVDVKYFRNEIKASLDSIREVDTRFQERANYLKISYERIVEKDGLEDVYRFLGYAPIGIVDKSRRQNSAALYSEILNYDELRKIYAEEY